tara:strand:+ start:150 stop:1175 length:1026 start_codon:yes stop_codon:yes gene_type:complete
MKKQSYIYKPNILKKLFIKLCRLLNYEIIDQNNLYIPTADKFASENLSIAGSKSINLPLGEVKITRPIKALDIIIKTCTSVNLVSQSKRRIFEERKSDYTFKTINSIIKSVIFAQKNMPNVEFKISIIDHNSGNDDLETIKNKLNKSKINNQIFSIDVGDFKNQIQKINEKNEEVTQNMQATMCSIYNSFLLSLKDEKDLVYFVEDDYIHKDDAITEMLFTYERLSSQLKRELVMCPTDYPFLYNKTDNTQIFLGNKKHWRTTRETLLTFLTSKKLIEKHWVLLENMCKLEHSPFEKPLHKMYETELCISPMPSLALHCTNANSVFGLSPNLNWKELWENN